MGEEKKEQKKKKKKEETDSPGKKKKGAKTDKPAKKEKLDKKQDKNEDTEKLGKKEKTENSSKKDKSEKKKEKKEATDKSDRKEKSEKSDKSTKKEKSQKKEKSDKEENAAPSKSPRKSPKKTPKKSPASVRGGERPPLLSPTTGKDDVIKFDKLWSSTIDFSVENDAESEAFDDGLNPIPPPDNPPMKKITLILKQPDLKKLEMKRVDPANTNIRMVRDFLEKNYYKGNKVPRTEQRQLLYRMRPIFDKEGDYNLDDAKTLADHDITKDEAVIELSKMHVYVVEPSTKQSMMINNIDPMNDIIYDMRKLALEDGYPIEKLRVLHKEASNKEIKKSQDKATFFECGVKHNHTLILEWPTIKIKIKVPIGPHDKNDDLAEGESILEEDGRKFKIFELWTQTELEKVQKLHDSIFKQTKIPPDHQALISMSKSGKKKATKIRKIDDPNKLIADFKVQENDVITLEPRTLKVNLVGGPDGPKQTSLENIYPNDSIGYIKSRIESGQGVNDGIPSIQRENQALRTTTGGRELDDDQETLHSAGIKGLDELDVEKTKITIKVKLPDGAGKVGEIVELAINPKNDDISTFKVLLSEKTGLPIEHLPRFKLNENFMEAENGSPVHSNLAEYEIAENDIISVEPIVLNVKVPGGNIVCIENVDPFTDTIEDIKKRLGPDEMNILEVDKQRLLFNDEILDVGLKDKDTGKSEQRLFTYKLKSMDTLDLEKASIDLKIKQPNGEILTLEGVDPRKDSVSEIEAFLSDSYYKGKDKDGSIPNDQVRRMLFQGDPIEDAEKSLREFGIIDDDDIVEIEPIKVLIVVPEEPEMKRLAGIDPMNDKVYDVVRQLVATDADPVEKWSLFHKEDNMRKIEDDAELYSFFVNGVANGDILVIKRKPITIQIRLPRGCNIRSPNENEIDHSIKFFQGEGDDCPTLCVKVHPDEDNIAKVQQLIYKHVGVPADAQKLNRLDGGEKAKLSTPNETLLSDLEVNIVADCTLELEPMVIYIVSQHGNKIAVEVLPFDTIADVKEKLAKNINIPPNKQRLKMEDGTELGGDVDNGASNGSDNSTLADLKINDGDILGVEKSKIALKVKMPNGRKAIVIVVDPKLDTVHRIRQQIFDATGLPLDCQQRLKFGGNLMDDGYREAKDGDNSENFKNKKSLSEFDLKEFDEICLDPARVRILQMPEKKEFVIKEIDPMNDLMYELKKRSAGLSNIGPFKQRLFNPDTEEEYVCDQNSTKTLRDFGIKDGDLVQLEKNRINLQIVLPSKELLELKVDPRKDDLQKVRDFIFKKYYKKRVVPKEHMRTMLRGTQQVLNEEPGEKKMIEFGIMRDDDKLYLKPCFITVDTPTKIIHCPNADPFYDTLEVITEFVEQQGIKADGLKIELHGKIVEDMKSVLYDLKLSDDATIKFVEG